MTWAAWALAATTQAAPAPLALPATIYYAGEARITDPFRGGEERQRILLIRQTDRARSRIVETACVLAPGRPPLTSPVYIRVEGDTLSVSDNEAGSGGAVTGTGRLVGEPWAWRELHFDMTYSGARGSVRIADLNLLLPGRLLARKQISVVGGPVVQLWEAELPEVAEAALRSEWRERGCAG